MVDGHTKRICLDYFLLNILKQSRMKSKQKRKREQYAPFSNCLYFQLFSRNAGRFFDSLIEIGN